MDQIIAVIKQNPLRILIPFHTIRVFAEFFELGLDFVGNCLNLAGVGAAADQEKVGERGDFAEVEDLYVLCLL